MWRIKNFLKLFKLLLLKKPIKIENKGYCVLSFVCAHTHTHTDLFYKSIRSCSWLLRRVSTLHWPNTSTCATFKHYLTVECYCTRHVQRCDLKTSRGPEGLWWILERINWTEDTFMHCVYAFFSLLFPFLFYNFWLFSVSRQIQRRWRASHLWCSQKQRH